MNTLDLIIRSRLKRFAASHKTPINGRARLMEEVKQPDKPVIQPVIRSQYLLQVPHRPYHSNYLANERHVRVVDWVLLNVYWSEALSPRPLL